MNLLIDKGNTSAKLAIADGKDILHTLHQQTSWTETISQLTRDFAINHCVVSTVAADDPELLTILQAQPFDTLWLGKTHFRITGGTIHTCPQLAYALKSIPPGYGADRLAADLGALSLAPPGHPLLVIDAGTCITYDLISAVGKILSGVISAGIQLRLKAMHEHTALLPLFEADPDTPLMGTDTRTAMLSSAIHGTRFEVEGYIRSLLPQYPDLCVFLTGGNTFHLSDDLQARTTHDPHLLFRGLQSIADSQIL